MSKHFRMYEQDLIDNFDVDDIYRYNIIRIRNLNDKDSNWIDINERKVSWIEVLSELIVYSGNKYNLRSEWEKTLVRKDIIGDNVKLSDIDNIFINVEAIMNWGVTRIGIKPNYENILNAIKDFERFNNMRIEIFAYNETAEEERFNDLEDDERIINISELNNRKCHVEAARIKGSIYYVHDLYTLAIVVSKIHNNHIKISDKLKENRCYFCDEIKGDSKEFFEIKDGIYLHLGKNKNDIIRFTCKIDNNIDVKIREYS